MRQVLFQRFGAAIIVMVGVLTLVFVLSNLLTDPTVLLIPEDARPDEIAALRHAYGVDKPLHERYFTYVGHLATGDLGQSARRAGYSVMDILKPAMINSAKLAVWAWLMAIGLGIPLGIISALHRGTWIDSLARFSAVAGLAIPGWWMGIICIVLFASVWNVLPAAGMGPPSHYVLPVIVLGHGAFAGLTRLTRSAMLDVLDSEFVKMARAKGLSGREVVWKHALRNALIPAVTFGGLYFAGLLTGAILIENIFAWPGMGRAFQAAIATRDYPVIQGGVMVTAALIITFNFLTDVVYTLVDPRIRYTSN